MITVTATELPRVLACNGSRLMPTVDLPQVVNSIRDEGVAAHWVAVQVFTRQVQDASALIDKRAPNGVIVSSDMAFYVTRYLIGIIRSVSSFNEMEYEYSFGEADWLINGRADFVGASGTTLFVDDFKYGYSLVEVDDNWTLIANALGYCRSTGFIPDTITFTIHQPRVWHRDGVVRSVSMTYDELQACFDKLAVAFLDMSDTLNTGLQCGRCHALIPCPAARRAGLNAIEATDTAYAEDMPNDAISVELENIERASKILADRGKALVDLARHRISIGKPIENYAIETQYGNRAWQDWVTSEMVSAMTGGKNVSKPGMITPAAAERLEINADLINTLTYRPIKGHKLVREKTDKRAKRLLGKT